MKYQTFHFKDYGFDKESKTLTLLYAADEAVMFTETFTFDFPHVEYDESTLDRALQTLFFIAGVSYYKAFLPPEIRIEKGTLTADDAAFLAKTYQKGLGEFFYVNQLDPQTIIPFLATTETAVSPIQTDSSGLLVGLGGGKDSLVSIELLRTQPKVATWSVGHRKQLQPLVDAIGLPHMWVERTWDRQLLDLNKTGAYNGHIPISAVLAAVGTVVAVLSGYRDVVVSNEQSSNEPTMQYQGVDINHQHSKSSAFERDYQSLLRRHFGDTQRYYSFLRPLSELHIAKIFSTDALQRYEKDFSSCNRAFTHDSPGLFWCGECPKCAFTFLILSAFVERDRLETLFGGKNLLLDPKLEETYRNLLGIRGEKPLECVGEIKESRAAMRLVQEKYPELSKYTFEIPADYDYAELKAHDMPEELFTILKTALQPPAAPSE